MKDCTNCKFGERDYDDFPCNSCSAGDKFPHWQPEIDLDTSVITLDPCPDCDMEAPASECQVDGDHYSKLPIQPFAYAMANGLDPLQHTIIKYVTRFRDKNGRVDLEKAKHTIDLLIQHEYEGGL